MNKVNIKNLTQTRCPLCFNKLQLRFLNGMIPNGLFYTVKGQLYKKEIKKVEKSNEVYFGFRNFKKIINKVYPYPQSNSKIAPHSRLKLNNKMFKLKFDEKNSVMMKYSMWECTNDNCLYYKCIDEIENNFGSIK